MDPASAAVICLRLIAEISAICEQVRDNNEDAIEIRNRCNDIADVLQRLRRSTEYSDGITTAFERLQKALASARSFVERYQSPTWFQRLWNAVSRLRYAKQLESLHRELSGALQLFGVEINGHYNARVEQMISEARSDIVQAFQTQLEAALKLQHESGQTCEMARLDEEIDAVVSNYSTSFSHNADGHTLSIMHEIVRSALSSDPSRRDTRNLGARSRQFDDSGMTSPQHRGSASSSPPQHTSPSHVHDDRSYRPSGRTNNRFPDLIVRMYENNRDRREDLDIVDAVMEMDRRESDEFISRRYYNNNRNARVNWPRKRAENQHLSIGSPSTSLPAVPITTRRAESDLDPADWAAAYDLYVQAVHHSNERAKSQLRNSRKLSHRAHKLLLNMAEHSGSQPSSSTNQLGREIIPLLEQYIDEADAGPSVIRYMGYILGCCMHFGIGCNANIFKAFALVREAAGMGNADALLMLGCWLLQGIGCVPNPVEARQSFEVAHGMGHVGATVCFACCILRGIGGLMPCPPQALLLFRQAAERGSTPAQLHVQAMAMQSMNPVVHIPFLVGGMFPML